MKLTVNEIQHLAESSNPALAFVLRQLQETYLDDNIGEVVLEIPADLMNLTTT